MRKGQYLKTTEVLLGKMKGRMDHSKTINSIHLCCVLCLEKLPCFFLKGTLHFVTEIIFDPTLIVESSEINLWHIHRKCTEYCGIFRLASFLLSFYASTLIFLLPHLSCPFLI